MFERAKAELKKEAPRGEHLFAAAGAAVFGAFFVFCGIALVVDVQWSQITNKGGAAALCSIPLGIGATLFYAAWRIYVASKAAPK